MENHDEEEGHKPIKVDNVVHFSHDNQLEPDLISTSSVRWQRIASSVRIVEKGAELFSWHGYGGSESEMIYSIFYSSSFSIYYYLVSDGVLNLMV